MDTKEEPSKKDDRHKPNLKDWDKPDVNPDFSLKSLTILDVNDTRRKKR